MTKPRFLVTGGSGFLGKYVVPLLREFADVDVLSRGPNHELQGHLSKWNAGLDMEKLKDRKYDALVHMAGLYDLKATTAEVYQNNVLGTNMALRLTELFNIPVFLNTSSIAAAANLSQSSVSAYDIDIRKSFFEAYGRSKAQAELQVAYWQGAATRLRVNLRLGVLVGESTTGKIDRVDGPYTVIPVLKKIAPYLAQWPGPLPLPGNSHVRLPFVPVDRAAQALVNFVKWSLTTEKTGYTSFHVSPNEGVAVLDFYKSAFDYLGLKVAHPFLVSKIPTGIAAKASSMFLGFPEEQLRYALDLPRFETQDTQDILGAEWCPEFHEWSETFWRGYENHVSRR